MTAPQTPNKKVVAGEHGFNDRGFALGMVRGLRSFMVAPDGRVTGCMFRQAWTPGENRAVCHRGYVNPWDERFVGVMRPETFEGRPDPNDREHEFRECSCGWWAYWGERNTYAGEGRVAGVIEGYGRTIVGSRGFRSARARIAALTIPEGVSPFSLAVSFLSLFDAPKAPSFSEIGALVSAQYPGVPVYRSVDAMVVDFPPDRAVVYTDAEGGA